MNVKAVFLDFYGTLVHEDDDIIPVICEEVRKNAGSDCSIEEIGSRWWKGFSTTFHDSHGDNFQLQRTIGVESLSRTIKHFHSTCDADELIQTQFRHWVHPKLYEDTLPFLEAIQAVPVYILSNIDTGDIIQAVTTHGIRVDQIITSEDVRAYKPRPEMFVEALSRLKL